MDAGKYNKSVEMLCPTCGGSDFSGNDGTNEARLTCGSCGLELTKSELIEANSENIAGHVDQVKKAVIDDVQKAFRDAFKGNKMFKLK